MSSRTLLLVGLTLCCLSVATAQTTAGDPWKTLRQLLATPAPPPPAAIRHEDPEPPNTRPAQFFSKGNVPPDDAPIDDLLEYWNRWVETYGRPEPSDPVRQRLLDACLAVSERLPRFLPLLSPTETTAAKIKELYDKEQSNQDSGEGWHEKVRKWLFYNSKYFLGDLLALANRVRDAERGGSIDQEEALSALARVDWQTAEPLLNSVISRGQPRTRALALTLFYRHAIDEKDSESADRYRSDLRAIAADRNAPGRARDIVIETLSLTEWPGRDDWYLSLFHDETLLNPTDGSYGFSPLTTVFVGNPDKWIPVMARLVEGKDQTVRSAAANCLMVFQLRQARVDALKPLLPWLSDPTWAEDRSMNRLRLIQSMENLDLPESVPGLIWVVEHDESSFGSDRSYAAESLAKYKDPRAVPALKKALAAEKDEYGRIRIIKGLLACDGLTETEQVEALEAYAAKLTTAEGREFVSRYRGYSDDLLPLPVAIGNYLSRTEEISPSLVHAVLARAAALKKEDPILAQSLLAVAHRWQGRLIDLDLIHRIAAVTADANTITDALERRAKLRETVRPELQALIGSTGSAQGIGTVLLNDDSMARSILSSGSQSAQVALLACARLTQMSLPVELVAPLLQSKEELLALAAEQYLLAEDSKGAQEILWGKHEHQAFVTGWQEAGAWRDFEAIEKTEGKLRAELLKDENAPVEIIAILAHFEQRLRVVRAYPNRIVYTDYEDSARYRERVLSDSDFANFKRFIATNHLPELGPQVGYCHNNCAVYEFLSLTRERGRRVFSHQASQVWIPIFAQFDLLGRGEGVKIHYNLEQEIKGLEVLSADEQLVVKDVWQQGADIRIFAEREQTAEEIEQRNKVETADDQEDAEAARTQRRREETARFKARFSWRSLVNGKVVRVVKQPETFSAFDDTRFDIDDDEFSSYLNAHLSQAVAGDVVILARNFGGLWKKETGQKAIRITSEGAYANPIMTPDGKWVVVAKTDTNWAVPNYVVRFNLQTGREYRIDLPPADQFEPVAYLPPGKILLRRAKDDDNPSHKNSIGPDAPEYYLLDPNTWQTQLASGVFAPLLETGKRFLQPTGKPDEFWAAIPDRTKDETRVGRYNLKDFSFQPLLTVPHIRFESLSMWVDEAAGKLYVVYEGHLLRLPLRSAQ